MKNTTVRPRALGHRGQVEAAGLWFPFALYSHREARRRVLANWDAGARVWQLETGLVLRFAAPQSLRADLAPGAVWVERGGWLLGAPLSDAEWTEFESQLRGETPDFAPRAGTAIQLALVENGVLQIVREAQSLDPGDWLDATGWQLQRLEPLGEIAPLALVAPVAEFDARRALDVPASPELARFLAQMRGEAMETAQPSWRERLKTLWEPSRGSGNLARSGESGGVKIGFSLRNLFQFRFGAGGDAPLLRAGERFSSELGFLFRPLLWIFGFAVLWNGLFGGESANLSWPLILTMGALAWGLLVLSRMIPTPDWMAHRVANRVARSAPSVGRGFSLDLMALLLLCGLAVGAWRNGSWVSALLAMALAFAVAILAHWTRRRLDSGGRSARPVGAENAGFGWLKGLFKRKSGAGGGAGEGAAKTPKNRSNPLNNWLWRTQLSRLFGGRQARYILAMMQMFERGDLDAALRHAVPFNLWDEGAGSPSISTPRARADLDFLGARGGGGLGLSLPPEIQERLTGYYRAAFDQLAAQNRVDEAAFVLAELLDAPLEAVEWLEKHRQWEKAAQLAETRDLDAGLVVRLWWLAGDRTRAVVVARRRSAFAEAIARLEREGESGREAAQTLRLLWAQNLALSGDYAGAVEAAWPVATELDAVRGVVGSWIERGLEGQGLGAARMLGRQAHFLDDLSAPALENWRERVAELLAEAPEESVKMRLGFAASLCEAPPGELARAAARRALRALARDAAHFPGWSDELKFRSKNLLDFAVDGPLRVDAGALKFPAPPPDFASRADRLDLRIEADDAGALALFDAAYLPDGSILLALGESGARLLNRQNRTVATFDLPCHRLVLDAGGERAIGVAMRGLDIQARYARDGEGKMAFIATLGAREWSRRAEVARLCRFDLPRKRAQAWGEAQIGGFAPHFENGQWLVTSGDSLLSLDASANAPVALWKTPGTGFPVCLASDEDSLALLSHFYEGHRRVRAEIWRFDLPSLTLRERRLVPQIVLEKLDAAQNAFIDARGIVLFPGSGHEMHSGVIKDSELQTLLVQMPGSDGEVALQIEKNALWLVVLSRSKDGVVLRLWRRDERISTWRGQIELKGAQAARFRLTKATLALCDNRGRLIVWDLSTGNILKNHRVF